jgi:predicted alpha/beta hydrolase family esterase
MVSSDIRSSVKSQPAILLVPGLNGSGPGHWQTIWDETDAACSKVDLADCSDPHRNTWINNLNMAIHQAKRPVVLVAHSLGCLAVAWWAQFEQREWTQRGDSSPVIAALLVAPPEVDFFPLDERVSRFAPTPRTALPFPSRLVASRDDPWIGFHTAQELARRWGSEFVDAGEVGHINADSQLGEWTFGREQLSALLQISADTRPTPPAAAVQLPRQALGDAKLPH